MLTNDKLTIFEVFKIDKTLPKFRGKEAVNLSSGDWDLVDSDSESFSEDPGVRRPPFQTSWIVKAMADYLPPPPAPAKPRWFQFWKRPPFAKVPEPVPQLPPPPPPPPPPMSILEFFQSVKNTAQELKIVEERAAGFETMIENAKRAGQHALVEELARGLEHHRAEAQLVALGLTKYVREEDVISFYKECPKGLRLSWVGNFGRAIPETVVHSKIRADDVGAFDNYVVLHYDPGAKSFLETEKEKEARKDPILFGLMRGKRVLYFVGDWVDELCDLTLDQLAERVGQESIQSLVTPSPYR